MQVSELTRVEYEQLLAEIAPSAPIEQLPIWQEFEATVPGRSPWGYVSFLQDGAVVAAASLVQYETHGYRYLRSHHAPVWTHEPSAQEESEALDALAAYVRQRDKRQVFARIAVKHELAQTRPCLSTLPYDTTVVIDVTGGEDEILSRMKPRGRRDVRKALRETPCTFADETALAFEDFAPYHAVMVETGERDGFIPAPLSYYQDMVHVLGEQHCRVYAARHEGKLIAWSLVTISGSCAVRYYAATVSGMGRLRAADALLFFECNEVASRGCEAYDLMGIGSEFAPETLNLNEFKTKFAKDGERKIAPDRDLPIKKGFYTALTQVKAARTRLRRAGSSDA